MGAQAGMDLEIGYKIKCLAVEVRPGATHLTRGARTDASVAVHNAATGAPAAAADVAIWVVDEAVLALARGLCPRGQAAGRRAQGRGVLPFADPPGPLLRRSRDDRGLGTARLAL